MLILSKFNRFLQFFCIHLVITFFNIFTYNIEHNIMKLTLKNLSKEYSPQKFGLKDFNLELRTGILGLLGPNGAGKSTLMRMLATITQPTSGTIELDGQDIVQNPNAMRKILGYLPQDFGVYANLNAIEFLEYIGAVKGLSGSHLRQRIDALLDEVNLTTAKKKPIGTYSGGMRQRVGIAQALLNDPQFLIFDEPTVGLDPEERVRFRNLLADLAGERIIILSSHIVSDIETIATDIAIVANGNLLASQTPEKIIEVVENKVFEMLIPQDELVTFKKKYIVSNAVRRSGAWLVRFLNETQLDNSQKIVPNLEDAYLWFITQSRV
jgi:ABC-type multidrug transport system ATPase subunit